MSVSEFVSQDGIHRRHGACQHCGWTDSLQKATRRQAAEMRRSGHTLRLGFRWICDDCISDLTGADQERPVTVGSGPDRLVSAAPAVHRSVA
jgi:hypothetical protein